jgi:hypothetical protein
MYTRLRFRESLTLSLLSTVMLSPTFVVPRATASTPYEANKATRFLNNPLMGSPAGISST